MTHTPQPVPFGARQREESRLNRLNRYEQVFHKFVHVCLPSFWAFGIALCLSLAQLTSPLVSVSSLVFCVLICCCRVGNAITKRSPNYRDLQL